MTPALTLWRALNAEPERGETTAEFRAWAEWANNRDRFSDLHPADRLAYFEGKVREKGWRRSQSENADGSFTTVWRDALKIKALGHAHTAALADFHAAARAIHALGMITDAQMKEIEDAI